MLLTYTDVLVLRHFRPPEEVAHYYAAAKILALVTFIHFSVSAAVAHRFSAHHVAGDRARRWPRSPPARCAGRSGRRSLMIALILAFGKPMLWLFGPDFQAGYPLMFILASRWWRGRRSGRRSACSTCWASSAAARWSMPACSR